MEAKNNLMYIVSDDSSEPDENTNTHCPGKSHRTICKESGKMGHNMMGKNFLNSHDNDQ